MSWKDKQAIPLCIPDNYKWEPKTGKCSKDGDRERSKLVLVKEAWEKLQEVKGPVCVVAIAGPHRTGKSYILSEIFGQEDVFPTSSTMDPETVGIWMWIVPKKHEVPLGICPTSCSTSCSHLALAQLALIALALTFVLVLALTLVLVLFFLLPWP